MYYFKLNHINLVASEEAEIDTSVSIILSVVCCISWTRFPHLKTHDFTLHSHTEAGKGAVSDRTGDNRLTALCLSQLVGISLTAVQGLGGEEADMAVPARDDCQQLLLRHQVDLVDLFVVPHPDYF